MQSPKWYYNRLRSMDAAEIASRLGDVVNNYVDAVRIRRGDLPEPKLTSGQSLQTYAPGIGNVSVATQDIPTSSKDSLIRYADQITQHRLTFFQHEDICIGDPIDWHRDWNQGLSSPLKLCAFLDYRDAKNSGDCKQVWEPNRHHQFLVLARAYYLTQDQKYADACVEQMLSWIEANPFGYGMNWRSPLELAIRLINWAYSLVLLRSAGFDIAHDEFKQIIHTMELLLWETERKLSSGTSANNHLIGELAGVYVAARYLSHYPSANKISGEAKLELEHQIIMQTFDDGCGSEHAFGYQFFVAQFHVMCLHAAQHSGDSFSSEYVARLVKMAEFIAIVSQATGECPMLGDHDDGYVVDLGDQANSLAGLIGMVRAVSNSEEQSADRLKQFGLPFSESGIWLAGTSLDSDTHESPQQPDLVSHRFDHSGYYLLQSEKTRASVLLDVAELGFGALAAHGHADALSVIVSIAGRAIFVDPDTYDYFSYPQWRHHFRTTASHNTVCIDGLDQSEILGPFLWGTRANTRLLEYLDHVDHTRVCGEHDGYVRLADPVRHQRSVELLKNQCAIKIVDSLICKSDHNMLAHFHCHPDCAVSINNQEVQIVNGDLAVKFIVPPTVGIETFQGDEKTRLGWYSDGYHQKRSTTTIQLSADIAGSGEFMYELSW